MAKKNSKQEFISAIKARGGLKHYDLGGGVNLLPAAAGTAGGAAGMAGAAGGAGAGAAGGAAGAGLGVAGAAAPIAGTGALVNATGGANPSNAMLNPASLAGTGGASTFVNPVGSASADPRGTAQTMLNPASLAGNSGAAGMMFNPVGTIAAGNGPKLGGTDVHGGEGGSQSAGGIIGSLTPQSQYSAKLAPTTQMDYTGVANASAGNALAGYGQSQNNLANQQALEQTFLQQGQGGGPDPVQHQLAMNTQTNVNNQAALAAGQRGASSNVGLMSRNIAKQGAATQQQAAGQAATLGAQQQLAAYDAAAKQQQAIAQGIAGQTAASNQMFATSAGANNTQNANLVSNYNQMQGINAATSMGNANTESTMVGNLASGVFGGAGSAMAMLADGGEVPDTNTDPDLSAPVAGGARFADSGSVGSSAPLPNMAQSFAGKFLAAGNAPVSSKSKGSGGGGGGAGAMMAMLSKGGDIKTPVTTSAMAAKGMDVPGKAKVKGNSLKNDTVPAMLSPDEIVLPRSVTMAGDAPARAAKFVQAIQAKQGLKRKAKK